MKMKMILSFFPVILTYLSLKIADACSPLEKKIPKDHRQIPVEMLKKPVKAFDKISKFKDSFSEICY